MKEGNPFGPFWDNFGINFDNYFDHKGILWNTDDTQVIKEWLQRYHTFSNELTLFIRHNQKKECSKKSPKKECSEMLRNYPSFLGFDSRVFLSIWDNVSPTIIEFPNLASSEVHFSTLSNDG